MNKKSLRELSKMLKAKKIDIEDKIETFKYSDNPQIKEIYLKLEGELRMLEAVLEYAELGAKGNLIVYTY